MIICAALHIIIMHIIIMHACEVIIDLLQYKHSNRSISFHDNKVMET